MRIAACLLLLSVTSSVGFAEAKARPRSAPVLVVGALHELHELEPAFDYDRLRTAIADFKPDVLVLEVRPDELAIRKATPGRPEYPAVIWPMLASSRVRAVAMEPGGAAFDEITGRAGSAIDAFRTRDPHGTAAFVALESAAKTALIEYWKAPAMVQDDTTGTVIQGMREMHFALAGDALASAQSKWDNYMAEVAVQTVRANPNKRVLVLGSYKNRALLEDAIKRKAPRRIIDAEAWFSKLAQEIRGEPQSRSMQ